MDDRHHRSTGWNIRLLAAAALLGAALLGPRAYILGWRDLGSWHSLDLKALVRLIISATYDVAYVAVLAGMCLIMLAMLRRVKGAGLFTYGAFLALAVLSLLFGLLNIEMVRMLGRPLNYSWLYYADFLRGAEARAALRESASGTLIMALVAACVAYVVGSVVLGTWIDRRLAALARPTRHVVGVCSLATLALYLGVGHYYLTSRSWPYAKLANPASTFLSSWLLTARAPVLFAMPTSVGADDFAPDRQNPPATRPGSRPTIKHVIIFVLESTPAEYLGAYGSTYGVTPNLDRWAQHAAVFENIYAHAPSTTTSLVSILCSVYPWMSFKTVAQEKPEIVLPSLTSRLGSHGFATGFFQGSDLSYQSAGAFVRARGFDVVQDYTQRESHTVFTNDRWPFLNGSDDPSTVESLIQWLEPRRERPTFTTLWTMMTHYPYFNEADTHPFGPEDNLFNRYLNALHTSDHAFGVLVAWLEREQLVDDTLLIVVGDHGEAFGRHDQLSHGNKIYEENTHVPLLLINPAAFDGRRYTTVGGLVDIAPTVTDLLGQAPPDEWQGRSLFASNRPERTYFFAPWSDYWFGYREGKIKFLFNATRNEYEIYDLSVDPTEQTNMIERHRPDIAARMERLAAWVQYQNRMFARLLQ